MTKFRIRWTETEVWETEVNAKDEEEAKQKLSTDKAQDKARPIKSLDDYHHNVEVERME